MKDNRKRVEKILYSYPMMKIELENLKLELENLKNEYSGVAAISSSYNSSKTNRIVSSVEVEVENKDEEINRLHLLIKYKTNKILMVESALKILNDIEVNIIQMKYYEKAARYDISDKLHITPEHVSYLNGKALDKLQSMLILQSSYKVLTNC